MNATTNPQAHDNHTSEEIRHFGLTREEIAAAVRAAYAADGDKCPRIAARGRRMVRHGAHHSTAEFIPSWKWWRDPTSGREAAAPARFTSRSDDAVLVTEPSRTRLELAIAFHKVGEDLVEVRILTPRGRVLRGTLSCPEGNFPGLTPQFLRSMTV